MPTVDTLKAYESLIAARVPEDQAKAILELVKTYQGSGVENLVTKAEFKEEMAALRSEMQTLHTEIYRVKFDLLKWLIPFLLGQLALTITVLFKLIK